VVGLYKGGDSPCNDSFLACQDGEGATWCAFAVRAPSAHQGEHCYSSTDCHAPCTCIGGTCG
jgi:hypothetical protein